MKTGLLTHRSMCYRRDRRAKRREVSAMRLWLLLGIALGLAAPPPTVLAAGQPLTVFAAASLKNSLDAVDIAYAARTGAHVRASYAASSALARQIEQGAPADVFISADVDWMNDVAQHGLLTPGTRRDLLTNHLALIAPCSSRVHLRLAPGAPLAQALGAGGRLAMAGADVPAGRYGRQALDALHLWDSVSSRVVYGDSVRAALAFVSRGEAPLGIVYDTDAKVDPSVCIVDLFPESTHPKILYPASLVGKVPTPDASAYLRFLQGPEASAIFRRFGFTSLPG
jgi:molybdate transport system substrate-binding protein